MSKIQIGNLQPAGVEIFQDSESFLTELQSTEAHQIHGGKRNRCKGGRGRNSNSNSNSNKSGSGSSKSRRFSGGGCLPPVPPICLPNVVGVSEG